MIGIYRAFLLAGLYMVAAFGLSASEAKTGLAQETSQRPNILVILTDDQDVESMGSMPALQRLLVNKGVTFTQAFATTPQCCPSRASFLRGQYAHNHGVVDNWDRLTRQDEGWEKFVALGREESTVATWLHEAGYSTGYMGKYMNGYGGDGLTTHIPPGWDTWRGWQGSYSQYGGRSGRLYKVNEDGVIKTYDGTVLHDTHYLAREAKTFIDEHKGRPWFLWVSPNPPHAPAFVAEEHKGLFAESQMPKPPSFNEADVSDKPAWIRDLARLDEAGIAQVEEDWRQRQESLQAVDDLIARTISKLKETGQLDNTYIVFTSDNGYLLYRHRVKSKGAPYEESIRLPFVVRGPGVPQGVGREQLIANTDLAPTIADWARIRPPDFVDGRSFAPQLSTNASPWRERLLIEYFHADPPPFQGVRTSDGKTYVECDNGDRELYDLETDPYQLDSLHASAEHQGLIDELHGRLTVLRDCSGVACRAAEGGTPPAPPASLTATPSPGNIALEWDDNAEEDLAGYNVYRADTKGSLFARLNSAPLSISHYDDAGAPVGKTSHYQVTAVDRAGNESAPAAVSATRPDVTPPQTAIVSGPGRLTNDPTPVFSFSATDDGSSGAELLYSHRVDEGQWSAYSGETTLKLGGGETGLADGLHTFEVKAIDAAGNEDQSPAGRTFSVDTKEPTVERVVPTENATGVSPRTNLNAFFSEAMRATSVNANTVVLFERGSSVPLAAQVRYEPTTKRAILNPDADLLVGKSYKAVVNIGVRDKAGNRLDQDPVVAGNQPKVWFFSVRS